MAAATASEVVSDTEALPRLVFGSVFKTDGASRKRAPGGFDSRALPLRSRAFAYFLDLGPIAPTSTIYTPRCITAYNRLTDHSEAGHRCLQAGEGRRIEERRGAGHRVRRAAPG